MAISIEPTTLDPAKTPDLYTAELLMHVFEGLVRYNAKNLVEPALAEKWDISKDGLTYTFHLRVGVTFQNGRPLTAEDFKYSWERALSPKTASPVAANYLDGIVGVKEVVAGKRTDLSGVQVIDPHTLQVKIDQPRAYFLGMLSYPTGWVVCKDVVQQKDGAVDKDDLIGTGPFQFDSYQPGVQIVLKANPHYWGGKPKLDRVDMPVILDPETAYNNFITGRLDVLTNVPVTRYAQDREAHKLVEVYKDVPSAIIEYVAMNEDKQPAFAKKEVRQAIALAIDRDQVFRLAYKSVGCIADGVLPPELPDAGPLPSHLAYDPAKARQLLAQAGYPDGKGFPALTLTTPQHNPARSAAAQIIISNLHDNLGINANLQEREFGEYLRAEESHALEFYMANWIADYPDPQDFLSTLFLSTASLNRMGYRDPVFDSLCIRADAEPNHAKRAALYSQANRLLMEDAGCVPLVFSPRLLMIQPNVQGWRANLCNYLPNTEATKIALTP